MIRQIQERPLGSSAVPLFLFHDASGNISSYYALGLIGRDVYAIADSRMESDQYESLPEKSRRHYAAIKKLVTEGRILLDGKRYMVSYDHEMTDRGSRLVAGWYGCTSSRVDLRDPQVDVDGVIMVDSPFPDYCRVADLALEPPTSKDHPAQSMNKLEKCILQTVDMLHKWKPPVWRQEQQPYTVMLRATEYITRKDRPALSFIDQFRDSPTLGWNEMTDSAVVDQSHPIQGHHFNIFDPGNVASVTNALAIVGVDMELSAVS